MRGVLYRKNLIMSDILNMSFKIKNRGEDNMNNFKGVSKEYLQNLTKENNRYKDFILLDTPIPFNKMWKDKNINIVQLYCIEPCGENHIVGFCGQCAWKNNTIYPLDDDSYYSSMLVYGYKWVSNKKEGINKGLDILVYDY